jgi:pSer/pThr/pTyr-binding forkhead associated (FHA) protein
MVQFDVLSGRQAGARWAARRFPVRIGRALANDLRLDDPGVWDEHLELALRPAAGFVLTTRPNALATVNGQPAQSALLRNGDRIEFGSVKLRFWLGEARQRGLRSREWLVWTAIAVICLGQVALIYWLLP